MKRSLNLTLALVAVMSVTAFADRIYLVPNNGTGDNFAFVGILNRHQLVLTGGADPYFFSTNGYLPGSTLGGGDSLYLYDSAVWTNGGFSDFSFYPASINMSTVTLPTDGRNFFRASVQISFSATGTNNDTGQTINVGGSARGTIPFQLRNGLYYADNFVAVPEPGTFGLMGTGVIAILASVRKKLSSR
jgi:hypothetical protein